jgi:hypothetical protein
MAANNCTHSNMVHRQCRQEQTALSRPDKHKPTMNGLSVEHLPTQCKVLKDKNCFMFTNIPVLQEHPLPVWASREL